MAIEFRKQVKGQRNLIYIFSVIVLITAFLLWTRFLKPEKPSALEVLPPTPPIKKLEINFDVLKNPFLEKLQTFEGLPQLPLEEKIGRENPFIPY